jgi:hypothetical protein
MEVPNLYSISGSANFFNKTDNGFTVYRYFSDTDEERNRTVEIHVQKVKHSHLGSIGMAELRYNKRNGRYHAAGLQEDNENYLHTTPTMRIPPNPNIEFISPDNFIESKRAFDTAGANDDLPF